ncbi:endoglucanase 4-like [Ptychodera flava]|uniref:endoglucanase 4-like n=1 Tax=Ptychodera flava TaxID=63121 RepID=UPI00396A14EB
MEDQERPHEELDSTAMSAQVLSSNIILLDTDSRKKCTLSRKVIIIACVAAMVLSACVLTAVFVVKANGNADVDGSGPQSRSRSRFGETTGTGNECDEYDDCLHMCDYMVDYDGTCTCPPGQTLQADQVSCYYDYNEVLHKSLLFYEAQRSGALPPNNRIPWRGDSALGDRGQNGEDLTGGYYDAGDHIKAGLPMAWSATVLAWGFIEFRDAYENAGEVENMLDCLRWFTDYFIKCHTAEHELYVHVGSVGADHNYWGRPENMTMARPAYKVDEHHPGSDVVGATAAAMAAASIIFKDYDADYAEILVEEAMSLYQFAINICGRYSDSVPEAKLIYASRKWGDEVTWAAMWLYKATGEQQYLTDAIIRSNKMPKIKPYAFSWGDVTAGFRLLLLQETKNAGKYLPLITRRFLDNWTSGRGGITYTPQGQAWRNDWGSLRYSTSTAFIALMAAHYGYDTEKYVKWAKGQVGIALGDTSRSFVVGYGRNPPQHPHHRSSSCPDLQTPCDWPDFRAQAPNPHVLEGALVGGPDSKGYYADDRRDYIKNEVSLDYNAGFTSATAALKHFELIGKL